MSLKKFKLRWSDIDANMHVRNTAYNDLFIQHRMDWLKKMGFDMQKFQELAIGPMVIHEHLYYIKEVRADSEVYIDMYLKGNSKDGKYVQLAQHLYNHKGELSCYLDITLVWLDVKARKIAVAPQGMLEKFDELKKTQDFKIIDSSALRVDGVPYKDRIDVSNGR